MKLFDISDMRVYLLYYHSLLSCDFDIVSPLWLHRCEYFFLTLSEINERCVGRNKFFIVFIRQKLPLLLRRCPPLRKGTIFVSLGEGDV